MRGLVIAHRCTDEGVPRFLTRTQRASFVTLRANVKHVFFFNRRRNAFAHLLQIRANTGGRLEVTPAGRCVWAVVAGEGLPLNQTRRLLKWARDEADLSWDIPALTADAGAPATAIKATFDMREVATRDLDGKPLTFNVALHRTVMGFDHKAWVNNTTIAEIDGESPRPWSVDFLRSKIDAVVRPQRPGSSLGKKR